MFFTVAVKKGGKTALDTKALFQSANNKLLDEQTLPLQVVKSNAPLGASTHSGVALGIKGLKAKSKVLSLRAVLFY